MRVSTSDGLVVGDWPAWPEVTAVLEAAGVVLAWDVLAGDAVPAARVHDPARAAGWLWEIYGSAAGDILAGARDVTVPAAGDWSVRDACRTVAQLDWAQAWWPASVAAEVPALDPVVLRAEHVLALSGVEHLLDDPGAVERALGSVALPTDPDLAGRLSALAADHGIDLSPAPTPARAGFALAAGADTRGGTTVLTGTSTVDWTLVPAGAVDAAAPAEWAVVRREGATVLDVSVVPGPRPGGPLAARFGDVEVTLGEADGLGRVTGSAPVPASVLTLPPDRRVVVVYAPGFAVPAAPAPGAAARQAAVIAYARFRVGSPSATLTERTAR
ncbi:hypothetical protein [Actinophytocola sp.]|uniref:hypothetical protein n=1 Tax=Actinophytocola sp. TaxID=1872138 RepID=UPI002D5F2660|nr:hypothetical protein [Actinophytocola sp.]HYQ69241.1 hypothetical protein [Actinophytocola sp.]